MTLRTAAHMPNVHMLLEGGPQHGRYFTLDNPGERFQITRPPTDTDDRVNGSYGLSHEAPGGVLVYLWHGWTV